MKKISFLFLLILFFNISSVICFDFGMRNVSAKDFKPSKTTWYNPISWFWSSSPGVIDGVSAGIQTVQQINEKTLPKLTETLDSVKTAVDKVDIKVILAEIKSIREESLAETKKIREMGDRFINTINGIPHFLKTLLIMTLGASISGLSFNYMVIPGVTDLAKAYSRTKPHPDLKSRAWFTSCGGILLCIIGEEVIRRSWNSYNSKKHLVKTNNG